MTRVSVVLKSKIRERLPLNFVAGLSHSLTLMCSSDGAELGVGPNDSQAAKGSKGCADMAPQAP
jgi:hypothetical protein